MAKSKDLRIDDSSGFEFAKEMLSGDPTAGINFDRIQKKASTGEYIIFEYLLCEEEQQVNPYTSHPKRYWHKNSQKFIKLWEIATKLEAKLILVNYAKKDTKHQNKILLLEVLDVNDEEIKTKDYKMSRDEFKEHFRRLNKECL